ncbi:MAG: aminotransferase [Rhodospirillaceae bacterium]|nr:aminotransferase [Rhodospirillaceae bacterium]|tara:strand:- start:369 stop:1577 length:1209 start_codon:yes stop_codon:yes gene_type:complete
MSIKRGRKFLNTPGPTHVPDRVMNAMHQSTLDLSDPHFLDVSMSCFQDLQKIFKTMGEIFLYASNGHGAWEAALTNVFSPGDNILVPETGNFSNAWSDMARALNLNVQTVRGDSRRAIDPEGIEVALEKDTQRKIKGVLVVHTETATGITNDLRSIRKAIDSSRHPALLVVDSVAALGTVDYRMDEWGIDVTVSASQKGLMMPPGLGIVAANEKAMSVHQKSTMPKLYWDWNTRLKAEHYRKFCGTAPQLMVFGMREALNMIFEEGLENVFERHRILAGATHAAVEIWGKTGNLSLNAVEPEDRSTAVTTVLTSNSVNADAIRDICRDEMMVGLGGGLGNLSGKAFRIGHMGDINAPMLYAALASVEATLCYLDIKHGAGGVTASVEYIAQKKKEGEAPFSY